VNGGIDKDRICGTKEKIENEYKNTSKYKKTKISF
jgi:hypothetical protein